jgi:hypothetical protein
MNRKEKSPFVDTTNEEVHIRPERRVKRKTVSSSENPEHTHGGIMIKKASKSHSKSNHQVANSSQFSSNSDSHHSLFDS